MVSEHTIGKIVFGVALILIGAYIYMIFSPSFWWWAITIVVSVIVFGALGMLAWIGLALARTPSIELHEKKE